ncbi:MAG: hypothetical protein PVJ57_02375 [Phycisphaerae bacterium]|jgi:hypothetical protein
MSPGEQTTRTIDAPVDESASGFSPSNFQPLPPDGSDFRDLPPTVWLLDEPECPSYDDFINEHPASTFYHSLAWQGVLSVAGFGHPLYLAAMLGDEVAGAMPLFETVSNEERRRLVSLPGTPVAGPLADDVACRWLLHSRALSLGELRRCEGLFVRAWQPLGPGVEPASPTWLRLPIAALLATVRPKEDHDAQIVHVPFDAATRRSVQESAVGPIAASLALHGTIAAQLQFAGWTDDTDRPQAGVVWCTHAEQVHVLAWFGTEPHTPVAASLLRSVAVRGAARGAACVDFPGTEEAIRRWGAGDITRQAQVSVELPLTAAAALS